MGERVWFATAHYDQRPAGWSDADWAKYLRENNSGFSGFPFPVLSGELWDGVTYRRNSDGSIVTFEEWMEEYSSGGYPPGQGPGVDVVFNFFYHTYPASPSNKDVIAAGAGTDYWLKFNSLEDAALHYWRPARLVIADSTYQHLIETKELNPFGYIDSTLKTSITALTHPISSDPVFIDRAPIMPITPRPYIESYRYVAADSVTGESVTTSGSFEESSTSLISIVKSGAVLTSSGSQEARIAVFETEFEGIASQIKHERTDSTEDEYVWWFPGQALTNFRFDERNWRLIGLVKVGDFYYGRTALLDSAWGYTYFNAPISSEAYCVGGYDFPSGISLYLLPQRYPDLSYEAGFDVTYTNESHEVPVSVKGQGGREIATGQLFANVHKIKGDYNISQAVTVSGGLVIKPEIYIPYANSKGQAVWDATSGAQLQNPVS